VYSLKTPETDAEKLAYHTIRRTSLFDERGRLGAYNDSHPDENREGNTPFLLMDGERPVGTVRVDMPAEKDYAVLRLVAVSAAERNKGHGGYLISLVESFAHQHNRKRLVLNSAPDAVNFYRKNGFVEQVWDDEELKMTRGQVQMVKIFPEVPA